MQPLSAPQKKGRAHGICENGADSGHGRHCRLPRYCLEVTSSFAKPAYSQVARPTDVIIREWWPAKASLMGKVSAEMRAVGVEDSWRGFVVLHQIELHIAGGSLGQ
jgi:hypothetical protein